MKATNGEPVTQLQEIERAIDALTPEQTEELYQWLDQHHPQRIDAQLMADLEAGRLDDRITRALADHQGRKNLKKTVNLPQTALPMTADLA